MWNKLSVFWCKHMHSQAMWPIHGRYICPTCLREYRVGWEHMRKTVDTPVAMEPPKTASAASHDSFVTM